MSKKKINFFRPVTPGQRFTLLQNREVLQKTKAIKTKLTKKKNHGGRNHSGQITVAHRGGGCRHMYRKIDFSRKQAWGIFDGIEYDPNRNTWIHRLFNPETHTHEYTLGVQNFQQRKLILSYKNAKLKVGHHHFLKKIPLGYVVHNLSSQWKNVLGGQYLRSAGTYGQVLQKTKNLVRVKLRSGHHRLFPLMASASLGRVSCEEAKLVNLGKAGRHRWIGFRPKVRGVAINPVDHPHGGGEGKTSGGRPSVTPWGKPTKGKPTTNTKNFFLWQKKKMKS